jgi:hypothetical protein
MNDQQDNNMKHKVVSGIGWGTLVLVLIVYHSCFVSPKINQLHSDIQRLEQKIR